MTTADQWQRLAVTAVVRGSIALPDSPMDSATARQQALDRCSRLVDDDDLKDLALAKVGHTL